MKISIASMLSRYAASLRKSWEHDRLSTVGASEVGQCIRKTWFAKHETPQDEGYEERWGAMLRGTLIENEYWVHGLRHSLPDGVTLRYAGADQRTLVDGYLSATSDGLLVKAIPGTLDEECLVVECKTIDPRVDIKIEKPEHSFQVQAQIGLIRHCTPYKPEMALISYIDASFLDDVREFEVKFDPAIYAAAQDRATRVMTAESTLEMPPEGKIAGGSECKYCAWASHCASVTVAGIPREEKVLGDNAVAELKALRDEVVLRSGIADDEDAALGRARQDLKDFLRTQGVRGYRGDGWSVSWFPVKGRVSVDLNAAKADGIDLSSYEREGDPGERLTVK